MNNPEFYIFNETGYSIFKLSPSGKFTDKAFQNILQALFQSAADLSTPAKTIATDYGCICYRHYIINEGCLLFVLVTTNYFASNALTEEKTTNLLSSLINSIHVTVGLQDLTDIGNAEGIERLRKLLNLYKDLYLFLMNSTQSLQNLLKMEEKVVLDKESLMHVKLFSQQFLATGRQDLYCFTFEDKVVFHSNEWLNIEQGDRTILNLLATLYSDAVYSDIPFYFGSTLLEDDSTGIVFK